MQTLDLNGIIFDNVPDGIVVVPDGMVDAFSYRGVTINPYDPEYANGAIVSFEIVPCEVYDDVEVASLADAVALIDSRL